MCGQRPLNPPTQLAALPSSFKRSEIKLEAVRRSRPNESLVMKPVPAVAPPAEAERHSIYSCYEFFVHKTTSPIKGPFGIHFFSPENLLVPSILDPSRITLQGAVGDSVGITVDQGSPMIQIMG